jgi:hypothetical protein
MSNELWWLNNHPSAILIMATVLVIAARSENSPYQKLACFHMVSGRARCPHRAERAIMRIADHPSEEIEPAGGTP